jgi:hypothetical protein
MSETKLDQENIDKIYEYNRLWLTDEKSVPESILENLEEEFFKANVEYKTIAELKKRKKLKEQIPNYLKGSLIGLDKSIGLKEAIRFRLFNYNILPDILKLSNFCVPCDFYRFKKCTDDIVYRNLITFFTTKENAQKLKYLNSQSVSYEYLAIDYDSVKYSKDNNLGKLRTSKPENFRFKTMSKNFKTLLVNNQLSGNQQKFQIPLSVNFAKYVRRKKNTLDKYENEIRVKENELNATTDKEKRKEIQDELKEMNKKILLLKNSVTSGLIDDSYVLESDDYYRRSLEEFKQQVKKKVNINLDLSEWSFCIVYSSQWCDKSFDPDKEILNGINDIQGIRVSTAEESKKGFLEKYSKILFNKTLEKESVDANMVYFIEETLKQPAVKKAEPFLQPGELTDFSLVFGAFQKYPDGGYWVKKIIKGREKYLEDNVKVGGKDRLVEVVVGPYSEEEAKIEAKIHNNIVKLEKGKSAKAFSFNQLVCQDDLLQINKDSNVNNYVSVDDMFYIPKGAQLFCLVHKTVDLVYFKRMDLTEKFRKFSDYAFNSGMRYVSTFDYLIYFDPDNKVSLRKAGEMKALLDSEDDYTPGEFIWMQDSILGKSKKRGTKPSILPFNISAELVGQDRIDYQSLKQMYGKIKQMNCGVDRLNVSFQNFYDTFGNNFSEMYKNKDYQVKTEINMEVVMDQDDDQGKKVKLIKDYEMNYEIAMKRRRKRLGDIDLISVKDIEDCHGYLNINFKNLKDKTWEVSKLDLFSGDTFFNNETVLIVFMMFMAKCFGVKVLRLDTGLRNSECDNTVMYHYYHIFYLGYGSFKKLEELGFMINNESKYRKIVNEIKDMTVINFVVSNKLQIQVDNDYRDVQISKFCQDFLETDKCFSKVNLIVINQISAHIEKLITLDIFNDLDERSFKFLEAYITHE